MEQQCDKGVKVRHHGSYAQLFKSANVLSLPHITDPVSPSGVLVLEEQCRSHVSLEIGMPTAERGGP